MYSSAADSEIEMHWPGPQPARRGAIEEELDRRVHDGRQRQIRDLPVQDQMHVDDGRLAEPEIRREHALGQRSAG